MATEMKSFQMEIAIQGCMWMVGQRDKGSIIGATEVSMLENLRMVWGMGKVDNNKFDFEENSLAFLL